VKKIESEIIHPLKKPVVKVQEKPIQSTNKSKNGFLRLKRKSNHNSQNEEISNGRWDDREHRIFLENSILLGNDWKKVFLQFFFNAFYY